MLKFFRKIRQKLINEGNLKRYLIYEIGEILLVVIGILIALQINNSNEKGKRTEYEFHLLQELKISIESNIKHSKWLIQSNKGAEESCQILLSHLNQGMAYHDSLNFHFNRSLAWFKGIFEFYAYENTKNHGLEFIKNDTLRRLLPRIYEFRVNWITTMESRQQDYNNSIVTPFMTEHFNSSKTLFQKGINTSDKIIPTNYDQLKNNKIYKNILQTSLTRREMDVFHQTRLKSQMERALNLLTRELDSY